MPPDTVDTYRTRRHQRPNFRAPRLVLRGKADPHIEYCNHSHAPMAHMEVTHDKTRHTLAFHRFLFEKKLLRDTQVMASMLFGFYVRIIAAAAAVAASYSLHLFNRQLNIKNCHFIRFLKITIFFHLLYLKINYELVQARFTLNQ